MTLERPAISRLFILNFVTPVERGLGLLIVLLSRCRADAEPVPSRCHVDKKYRVSCLVTHCGRVSARFIHKIISQRTQTSQMTGRSIVVAVVRFDE